MIDIEYANAYKEVLEILKYIPNEEYQKIPQNLIELFRDEANNNNDFKFDINKKINEQQISDKAKTILAILFRDYWATEEQREIILKKERYDREKSEIKKRIDYSPDEIFKKNKKWDLFKSHFLLWYSFNFSIF